MTTQTTRPAPTRAILRHEGAAALVAATTLYARGDGGWGLFAAAGGG